MKSNRNKEGNTMKERKYILGFLLIFSMTTVVQARMTSVLLPKGNKNLETIEEQKGSGSKKHSKKESISSKEELLPNQEEVIKTAVKMSIEDGFLKPKILAAIIYQESKAGTANLFRTASHKGSHDQSVGLGQIKAETARHVLRAYPELIVNFNISNKQLNSNSYLVKRLGYDDKFNLAIASKYLIILYKIKPNINWVIAAYNMGPGNAMQLSHPETYEYVKLVNSHIKTVKDVLSA